MKAKYVFHGLISLYVIFHKNWTMWSINLPVNFAGEGESFFFGRKNYQKLHAIL